MRENFTSVFERQGKDFATRAYPSLFKFLFVCNFSWNQFWVYLKLKARLAPKSLLMVIYEEVLFSNCSILFDLSV